MNKLTKAAIAGAAGIALLLGGAGSLAYWNSSAGLSGGTVSSGVLTVAASGPSSNLLYSFNGATATTFDPATNKIVPGDTVTLTQNLTVTAVGTHLKASLTIDKSLAGALQSSVTVSVKAYTAVAGGGTEVTGLSNLTATQAASIMSVVVTVAFPNTVGDAPGSGTDAQNSALTLGNLKVLLTQIP